MSQSYFLFIVAAAALPIAGCTINASDHNCGSVGDSCWDDEGCGAGLACGDDDTCETGPSGAGGGGGAQGCMSHAECNNGFFCDDGVCLPGSIPCADLPDETACAQRNDCEPVYAGVNCSCGANCQCEPGQAGCVCESFEYFACATAN